MCAFYFGDSISEAARAREEAGRAYIQNLQANREFAVRDQQRNDNLALQRNTLLRQDQRQRAVDQSRMQQLMLGIARVKASERIARQKAVAAAQQDSIANALAAGKADFDQQVDSKRMLNLQDYRGERLKLDREKLGNQMGAGMTRDKNVRSLGELDKLTKNTPLTPAQREASERNVFYGQRRAKEWRERAQLIANQWNSLGNFENEKARLLNNPQASAYIMADQATGKFIPIRSAATDYPTDALFMFGDDSVTPPEPVDHISGLLEEGVFGESAGEMEDEP